MQNKGLWIGIGLFIAAVLAGLFFLRKPQPTPTTTQTSPTPGTGTTAQPTGEVREITVEGSEYSFSPESLTVAAGERVSLTFKNTGNLPHNFTIDELGVRTKTIAGGQTDVVEFTAGASGTFTFYCSLAGHRQLGMEGDLEVQ
ncbi:MAG: Copper binding protein, plastocyanin/azurin family [Candidatus Woesebacteria bacterium GW2011_GWC2_45_9]|uniref:Copper binding protein, plastocyanin/azurin family n=1 Tax=Candidatus Woesebacteria bacterium GW2011_GWC2_45_9 TaxID=1618589 RepID=A0A0G1NA73_9BACT|nr:MAG: Copper binding protein, plastocyanin/azurin family [Candidatus Woesebacteria bacterium GW2011_GWC2_45_9]